MDTFEACDFCGVSFPFGERRAAALPKPSEPNTLVAVMWGCGSCPQSRSLPKATALAARIEAGKPVPDANGVSRTYLFANL